MKVEENIIIDRSCKDVFAFLAVRNNDRAWMGSVVESEWLDPAAVLEVGRRGRMVLKLFGRRSESIDEVTAYEPGRRIAHRTIEGSLSLSTACLTQAEGTGCRTTVLAEADRLPGGWAGRLAAPMVARIIRRGFKADLATLKNILEADGVARPMPVEARDRQTRYGDEEEARHVRDRELARWDLARHHPARHLRYVREGDGPGSLQTVGRAAR